MSAAAYTVEAIRSESDLERLLRLATATFNPDADQEAQATSWRDWIRGEPSYRPELIRGVYSEKELVGGCVLYDWDLRVPGTSLRTVCIGAVFTSPDHRYRGVARALMEDCTRFAVAGGYPLLLLHGIPGFYDRFGYADVADIGTLCMKRAAVAALPDPGLEVRAATTADAAAVLALYRRQHYPYAGSFVRDEARQRNLLAARYRADPPHVAIGRDGEVRGYAQFLGRPRWAHLCLEAVAVDWPATAALLKTHAARLERLPEWPEEFEWQVPERSATAHLVTDHLPARWIVRHSPNEGWMARVGDISRLLQRLAPLWDARWRERRPAWSGFLEVAVDGERARLAASGAGLAEAGPGACDLRIELPGNALCQLLFGFRPASWIAGQLALDGPATAIVEALFPAVQHFICGSDSF